MAALYFDAMKVFPKNPWNEKRDRFILSKGHADLALYTVLAHRGYITRTQIDSFITDGSALAGHPEGRRLPGVEATTGSLGHGLSVGVGMALAASIQNEHHRVFVLISDGECNEGEVWEAAMVAAHHKLDHLTVIIDYNHIQAFGRTHDVIELEPLNDKWKSFGWEVVSLDGHDIAKLTKALAKPSRPRAKPLVIIANTVMGKGVSFMEDLLDWHYLELTENKFKKAMEDLSNPR
ncbi:transketolase [Candidatus Berkelbacteria bacterium]|nr:transketolase [Candidatus Berkelbacteria bacterium]